MAWRQQADQDEVVVADQVAEAVHCRREAAALAACSGGGAPTTATPITDAPQVADRGGRAAPSRIAVRSD